MLQNPLSPQVTREILIEEVRFAALQVDSDGLIVTYDGIDLPDICLQRREVIGKPLLDVEHHVSQPLRHRPKQIHNALLLRRPVHCRKRPQQRPVHRPPRNINYRTTRQF